MTCVSNLLGKDSIMHYVKIPGEYRVNSVAFAPATKVRSLSVLRAKCTHFLTCQKENLPKVTLEARKGHISIFEPKESSLDPY